MSSSSSRWQAIGVVLLITWLYAMILFRLVLQWANDPNFGHGFFVPLFALFVLWQDRKKLAEIPSNPSWAGLPLIVLSMVTLTLGQLGADIFLPRASLLILLAGLIILFQGWTFFRAVLFPWAFLILMVPIPTLIMNEITFPLQLLASKVATELLRVANVVVLREGNLLTLAAMQLDVAEACSGLRSLLSLVTLAIIYGYLMEARKWVRVLLVFLAVPIAVVANSIRVFGTGLLVQYGSPELAEGFLHKFQGLVVFVVALVMLFVAHRVISLIWKSGQVAPREPAPAEKHPGNALPARGVTVRFWTAAALMLGTAVGLQAHAHTEYVPPRAALSSLPSQIAGWTAVSDEIIDEQELDILGHPEYVLREYASADQSQPPIEVFIAYFSTQKAGETIHSPNHCLPGAGWVPTSRARILLSRPDGSSFPVNRFVVTKMGDRQLALYWFQAHGREVASEWQAKYFLVSDSIRMNRSDGGLVRVMSKMFPGESADAAQARIMKLGSKLIPSLDQYIPR